MSAPADRRDGEHGYETADARVAPLMAFAIGLTILVGVVGYVVARLESGWTTEVRDQRGPDHPLAGQRGVSDAPALQADPVAERVAHEAQEAAQLSSYGWVDREQGIVRLPIETAMQRLLVRGPAAPWGEGESR